MSDVDFLKVTGNSMKGKVNIFWFRRDLRFDDNIALYHALSSELPVLPLFIFDSGILDKLTNRGDARVSFIYNEIEKLKKTLEKDGRSLCVLYAKPLDAFLRITKEFDVEAVFANKDYEPYAIQRDTEVAEFLKTKNIQFRAFKDHVIFEENEVLKDNGEPYTVFTPYSRKWKKQLAQTEIAPFSSEKLWGNFLKIKPFPFLHLEDFGFVHSSLNFPSSEVSDVIIREYATKRDLPAVEGTSKLGLHLRFGTVSIRKVTLKAHSLSDVFLNELIWRNFFIDILWHFPYVVNTSFKPKYNRIEWRNNAMEFEKWCRGNTGYPMVDAGMRELNETGFMHNRVRMLTASFLTKHLLIDWRWGEAYFAEKLLDYELASNNGNWQWAAGSGCDAVPYFRVFNPEIQQKKFDPKGEYIFKWIPEHGTLNYPAPLVEHKFARERALAAYKNALD